MTICVTHSGAFHADDVCAGVLLKLAGKVADYRDIVRSRNQEDFDRGDIVFDVGGEYDAERGRFDHHQRGQSGEFWEDETPLSSAGLLWKKYGELICPDEFVRSQLSDQWIRPIDADDNGTLRDVPKNCRTISAVISDLNPCWNDEASNVNECYAQACELMETFIRASIRRAEGSQAAYDLVVNAVKKCAGQDILVLEQFCPWKGFFHKVEETYAPGEIFKFVVFPGGDEKQSWKVFQIPVAKGDFEGRADLPEPWGGLREEELQAVSGISDLRFVHPNLFCGGADSFDGAVALARAGIAASAI